MLWLITGGVGSGKSGFAAKLALSVGREGIYLTCPPYPRRRTFERPADAAPETEENFVWATADADETLAAMLHNINVESNIFRAERRVLVIDSLSGWLRGVVNRARPEGKRNGLSLAEAAFDEVMSEIMSFQGKMIVVSEEPAAGLTLKSWERWFAYKLADANRRLSEESRVYYRLAAGVAMEVKGYRVEREDLSHENIYADR